MLWMALSAEEKAAKGPRKLFTAKQLRWRKLRRERAAEAERKARAAKKEAARQAKIAARVARRDAQRARRAKRRRARRGRRKREGSPPPTDPEGPTAVPPPPRQARPASLAHDGPETDSAATTAATLDASSAALGLVASPGPATDTAATADHEAGRPGTDSSAADDDNATAAGPAAVVVQGTPISSALSLPSLHRDRQHSKPRSRRSRSRTRPRLQRISISRDQSEQHYKEFRKLLFQQDDHKARVFKAQFRGGNPFIKKRTPKLKAATEGLPVVPKGGLRDAKGRRVAGKITEDGQYHCQSRRCAAVVVFPSDRNAMLVTCGLCGHLNNRAQFVRIDAAPVVRPPPVRVLSFSEQCRAKFQQKLKERFIEQLDDVIHHVAASARAGVSPGKRVWKEFDNTQLRLQHPWRAPPAPGAKYDIDKAEGPRWARTLGTCKSVPAITLYPKRHQMRFDRDEEVLSPLR